MRRKPATTCTSPLESSSRPWRGVLMGLAVGAMLAVGCAKSKPGTSPSSEAPADSAVSPETDPEAGAEPDDGGRSTDAIGSLELELAGYEEELLSAGIELPKVVVEARTDMGKESVVAAKAEGDAGQRCQRVCGLATSICDLRDRICELGNNHEGEPRYLLACERATLDCERATEACEGCDG